MENNQIDLKPGDLFCSENPMSLGRAINKLQAATSPDGKSKYSHSGIITSPTGKTLEALWTVKNQNLYEAYSGQGIVVARWKGMNFNIALHVLSIIEGEYFGKWYPAYRLPFHIVPFIAKYLTFNGKYLVCSELVAKYLWECHKLSSAGTEEYPEPRHRWYTGTNPDRLSDEFHRWKYYDIIFEGILD